MKYLKNIEVAEKYAVNHKTINNWIENAKEGKNNLQLYNGGTRFYILNSSHNHNVLKELVSKGKKFKQKTILKTITPNADFYKVFNESHIIEIISNLEKYNEIPHKFTYFNGGAEYWDNYVKRTIKESLKNTITNTNELLNLDRDYIFELIKENKKVNLVDIGVGNAYPVKDLLQNMLNVGILNKYIALDLSPDMLAIAKNNIQEWFVGKVTFEGHIVDISNETIRDLLFKNSYYYDNTGIINLVCFIGSTIENFENNDQSLENIKKSMNQNDILLLGRTLDTMNAKMYFDFSETNPAEDNTDDPSSRKWKWFIEALNLPDEFYTYEMLYDDDLKCRIGQISLEVDLDINFKTPKFEKTISFVKGEKIVTWRHKHHSYTEIINEMIQEQFEILHSSTSMDKAQILVIATPKSDN